VTRCRSAIYGRDRRSQDLITAAAQKWRIIDHPIEIRSAADGGSNARLKRYKEKPERGGAPGFHVIGCIGDAGRSMQRQLISVADRKMKSREVGSRASMALVKFLTASGPSLRPIR
jgi:hypothetical protein